MMTIRARPWDRNCRGPNKLGSGEQDWLATRNYNRVLVVRGEAAVGGAVGPAVLIQRDFARACCDDRFNGNDKALGQFMLRGEISVIGHRRRLVNGAPDAMAAEFLDDVKASPPHFALDGSADVFGAVPHLCPREPLPEGSFRATGQVTPRCVWFVLGKSDADCGIRGLA